MSVFKTYIACFFVLAMYMLCFNYAYAIQHNSGWERVNGSTVSLKGEILEGSFKEFLNVFDETIRQVVLNSRGGDTYEAIQIGRVLKNAEVDILVRGLCLSSCANYLFLAGKKKIIENGIVGFHGNTIALIEELGGIEKAVSSVFPSSHRIQVNAVDFRRRTKKTMEWEKEFLEALDIPQEFFSQTQRADKGMYNGESYDFLLPDRGTFEKYNIQNILGDHSKAWIEFYLREERKNGRESPQLLIESAI